MAIIYVVIAIVISYALIKWLFVIFLSTEKDEKKAKIEIQKLVLPIILGALVAFAFEQIPSLEQTVEEWLDKVSEYIGRAPTDVEELPKIIIGIGEMRMEIGDEYVVPYTFDSPDGYEMKLIWCSSNEKSVRVSAEGKLRAIATGQAEIAVSFKKFPDVVLKTFRVFVHEPPINISDNDPLKLEYSGVCQQPNDKEKYLVYFDIIRNEPVHLTKIRIELFTDSGTLVYEETLSNDGSSLARSNCAGTFSLAYDGTYLVLCTAVDDNGNEYKSDAHILRPCDEIEK